jgi:hypothetical protein
MHRRIFSTLLTLLCVAYLSIGVANAADKTLSLVSSSGQSTIAVEAGAPIAVEVRVDNALAVAGASFTVTYDTANLTLTNVESVFFGTFVSQSIPTPLDQGYVTVDSTNYYSPIVDNSVSGLSAAVTTGSMLAAARIDNGTGLNATLFTLHFTLTGNVGTYPINIIQSKINNVDAGYSAEGDLIPFLVGIDEANGTYPAHNVITVNSATLVISPVFTDTDEDLIDDYWETSNTPPGTIGDALDVYSNNGADYDKDGYSDYQEYLNRNILDPDGAAFNPTVVNAADGVGYIAPSNGGATIPTTLFLLLDLENE